MNTAIFPQSTFHIDLLSQNYKGEIPLCCNITNLNISDEFSCKKVYIGKEEYNYQNIFKSIKSNKTYYKTIFNLIEKYNIEKIIIFNLNTPLSYYLYNTFSSKIIIELWEDGLEHYIMDYGGINYFFKSMIKFLMGGYIYNIFKKNFRELENLHICNRFEYKNLSYIYKDDSKRKQLKRILFIGQPLVEDNIISEKKYFAKLLLLSQSINYKIDYIPHPREKRVYSYNVKNIEVIQNDYSTEKYLLDKEYIAYLSIYSTVLLNINRLNKSYYLSNVYELKRITKKISKLNFLPVKLVFNIEEMINEINSYKSV